MALALPFLLIAAALIALVATPSDALLLGLDHASFARASMGVAFLSWMLVGAAQRAGASGVARVVGSAATWALLVAALVVFYNHRDEFGDVFGRLRAELIPEDAEIGRGGEVIVKRRLGGEFLVPGRLNDQPVTFLFDTGASEVTLRAEDAQRAGLNLAALVYDVNVVTANGSAMAANVRLDRLAVGPILARNVRALVARPGALSESLLGMSFLERLKSYSVERGKLILKGG